MARMKPTEAAKPPANTLLDQQMKLATYLVDGQRRVVTADHLGAIENKFV